VTDITTGLSSYDTLEVVVGRSALVVDIAGAAQRWMETQGVPVARSGRAGGSAPRSLLLCGAHCARRPKCFGVLKLD
jgi:hypothetical protein